MIARENMQFDLRLAMGANLPPRMGFGPSPKMAKQVTVVGVNTARFAPSIMTPTVRMGLGPSTCKIFRMGAVGVNPHRTDGPWSIRLQDIRSGGGSEPPPYGWASVHPYIENHRISSGRPEGQSARAMRTPARTKLSCRVCWRSVASE